MKKDRRLNWQYSGCKILPVNCQHPTWGKQAEPMLFDGVLRNRYWRVILPDKTWVHCATKALCRRFIELRGIMFDFFS